MPGGSLTSKPAWWKAFGRSITPAFFMVVVLRGHHLHAARKSVGFVTESDGHFASKRHGCSFEGDSLMTTATKHAACTHHQTAASEHEMAAHQHREAAQHHEQGEHDEAKVHASSAQAHSQDADRHSKTAHQHSQK